MMKYCAFMTTRRGAVAHLLELGSPFRQQNYLFVQQPPVLSFVHQIQDCCAGHFRCRDVLCQSLLLLNVKQALQSLVEFALARRIVLVV